MMVSIFVFRLILPPRARTSPSGIVPYLAAGQPFGIVTTAWWKAMPLTPGVSYLAIPVRGRINPSATLGIGIIHQQIGNDDRRAQSTCNEFIVWLTRCISRSWRVARCPDPLSGPRSRYRPKMTYSCVTSGSINNCYAWLPEPVPDSCWYSDRCHSRHHLPPADYSWSGVLEANRSLSTWRRPFLSGWPTAASLLPKSLPTLTSLSTFGYDQYHRFRTGFLLSRSRMEKSDRP